MKPLFRCFAMFIRQILKDSMLYAVLAAPVLAGCLFHFGIPQAEALLCGYFHESAVLSPYYLLFDLFLAVMTPYMFCFASAMVLLTERDENMAAYIAVTPVGKGGYIVSRLVFPAVLSVLASAAVMGFFTLTVWPAPLLLLTCGLAGMLGIAVSLLIVSYANNRVEGMALAKLSGMILLGLVVPFFLFSGAQYLFAALPSYWIARLCTDRNGWFALPAVLTSLLWIAALYRRFQSKLS